MANLKTNKKNTDDLMEQEVERHFESLLKSASTETVRRKLRNLDSTCRHMVQNGVTLTVPSVVRKYKNLHDDEIGESTIRNKRAGENLYQSLYRKWEQIAATRTAAAVRKLVPFDAGGIGEDQIRLISDPGMQHAVTLLVAKARSLESQLQILKAERADVPLRIEGMGMAPGSTDLLLSDAELDSVRDFIDERKLRAKHLKRTTDHGVHQMDGRAIADPGFITALEKIARSYEPR